jgi:formamidopyrimidine-DNA glycosylase
MPSLDEFQEKVLKRGCPIKALLLDQSFSAGVGNWIAGKRKQMASITKLIGIIDEVLFHSAIHPEQVAKTLTPDQMASLHHNIVYVCQTAVDVNADSEKFPSHWLFNHRWVRADLITI